MGGLTPLLRPAARLFQTLFPPACPLCLKTLPLRHDEEFCPSCRADFHPLPSARCPLCALPYAGTENSEHLCGRCSVAQPAFSRVFAAGLYAGGLRRAVHQFKFNRRVALDRPLARLLFQALPAGMEIDLVIPVPLHLKRLRQRHYNQAQLLAEEVAKFGGWSLDKELLLKIRATEDQHNLSARQRETNLRGVFQLQRRLAGEHVLLIDDVMTTGATVAACAQILMAGGAERVSVAVLARAA